ARRDRRIDRDPLDRERGARRAPDRVDLDARHAQEALLLLDAVERHAQALDRLRARLRIRAGAPEEVDASDALGRGREPDAQPPVLRFRRRPGVEERAGEPRLLGRADLAHAPALPGRPLEVLEGEIAAVEGVA